jgi:hypothetical protein
MNGPDRALWQACAGWVAIALAKDEGPPLSPVEEANAITRGTSMMIEAGAYLVDGKVFFPRED